MTAKSWSNDLPVFSPSGPPYDVRFLQPPKCCSVLAMTEDEQADLVRKVLDCKKYESKPWTKFKIADVLDPQQNRLVQMNQYWVVTPDSCVLAFNSTLQCNPSEQLAEMLRSGAHRYCTLQKFDTLFIPLSSWEIRQ